VDQASDLRGTSTGSDRTGEATAVPTKSSVPRQDASSPQGVVRIGSQLTNWSWLLLAVAREEASGLRAQ
jgi:hypothetical protein